MQRSTVASPAAPPGADAGRVSGARTGSVDGAAGRLMSVNVGLPQDVAWQGRTVHTAGWKAPGEGPRLVRRLNIDGDGQGDLAGDGGGGRGRVGGPPGARP